MGYSCVIPGVPTAQARSRSRNILKAGRVIPIRYDPAPSRDWKAICRTIMEQARGSNCELLEGAISLYVAFFFPLPPTRWRRRQPLDLHLKASKPDLDNLAKGIKDSAKGIWWHDDAQVAVMRIVKAYAPQGVAGGTLVVARSISPEVMSECRIAFEQLRSVRASPSPPRPE